MSLDDKFVEKIRLQRYEHQKIFQVEPISAAHEREQVEYWGGTTTSGANIAATTDADNY